MPYSSSGKGVAVICDDSGIILQIIQNDYDLSQNLTLGRSLMEFFDPASLEKLALFFQETKTNGSAFDWELILPLQTGPVTLNCAAVMFDEKLLVVGATTRDSTIQVIEEMLKINNEQTNHLRIIMKDLQTSSRQLNSRDESIYVQLTQLNNELSVVHRELLKKNHELAELNLQKNYFLGMAAHDLRTPLGAIVSYTDFLLDEEFEHTPEDDRELLGIIKKSSEFMFGLINDLLDISKIESGNLQLDLKPVNIYELINHCTDINRVLSAKKFITINIVIENTLPETLLWDRSKIEQALNNLIGNAIKFSHPESAIVIRLLCKAQNFVIQVEDKGDGLPDDIIDQLFTPFCKGSRIGTRGEKGSGLGLSIARRIVEGHGGTIHAENNVDAGTRFIITLPIRF